MKKNLISILAGALFATNAIASPTPVVTTDFHLPEPIVEVLPNGLKIAWFIDDKLPLLDLSLLVNSGTRNDPVGRSGTVELLSNVMERGSAGFSPQEMARKVESLGASASVNADEESMSITAHGLSEDAEKLLDIVGMIASSPNFQADEIKREKDKLEENWKHLADSAESLSGFVFGRAILGGTPYARGSVQDLKNLRSITKKDLEGFHKKFFVPKNAILLVVGRVDRKAYGDQIRKIFNSWKGPAPTKTDVRYQDPRFVARRGVSGEILLVDRPDLPQAQVRLGFPVPGLRSKLRHSLAVANALLGEYFNSRLNLVVRDRMGLAYGIDSNLTYLKDAAFLTVASATAAPNTGKLLDETIRQLRLVRAGDILAEEVQTSKDYLLGGFPLSLSTLGAVATRWLGGYTFDLGPDYLNSFIPRVSAVTRESTVKAVSEAFALDRMVIVVSGDAAQIEKSLREKGFKKIRKISAKGLL